MRTLQVPVSSHHTPITLTREEIKFTETQWRMLEKIVGAKEFDFACSIPSEDRNQLGPYHFLYYTKDNRLHITRLGQRRILAHVTT